MSTMNATAYVVPLSNDKLSFALPSNASQPHYPVYYTNSPQILEGVSDQVLTLAAPVLAYWVYALFFHYLDNRDWKWLQKYRFHESAEVAARNSPSLTRVFWAVILQQIIQTGLGIVWLSEEKPTLRFLEDFSSDAVIGIAYYIYWWAIPTLKFGVAMFIMDTWFYFGHRFMHMNEFLYKNIHSVHHRLYVPYAIGALYNHPVEALVLDSLGAAIAEAVTGMTTRQAMALFTLATLKAVDDHCGYNLPFDPFQILTTNTASIMIFIIRVWRSLLPPIDAQSSAQSAYTTEAPNRNSSSNEEYALVTMPRTYEDAQRAALAVFGTDLGVDVVKDNINLRFCIKTEMGNAVEEVGVFNTSGKFSAQLGSRQDKPALAIGNNLNRSTVTEHIINIIDKLDPGDVAALALLLITIICITVVSLVWIMADARRHLG
ncbi:hypothetical protein BDQ17DRAFT_1550336 [Cyathus striatus]|nr:hypothetical protein BDQ17DRAFT_1550336 [Cyathus striatus]